MRAQSVKIDYDFQSACTEKKNAELRLTVRKVLDLYMSRGDATLSSYPSGSKLNLVRFLDGELW